jgi:hypothetical protein
MAGGVRTLDGRGVGVCVQREGCVVISWRSAIEVSRKEAWPISGVVVLFLQDKCTVLASQANDDWTNKYRA